MRHDTHRASRAAQSTTRADHPAYMPRIDTTDILRDLIANEIRGGRLTRARRRAVEKYATQFGLSTTQATRLVDRCRDEATRSHRPTRRRHALRQPDSRSPGFAMSIAVMLALIGIIALDYLLITWLAG